MHHEERPRTRLTGKASTLLWLLTVWLVAFASMSALTKPLTGAIGATCMLLAVISGIDLRVGLWVALTAALYDRYAYHWLWQYRSTFPPQVHLVDLAAAGLLVGFLVRLLRRRVAFRWCWYDTAVAVLVALLALSALRGLLAGWEHTLRNARVIPSVAVYFPARQALAGAHPQRVIRLALIYGFVICLLAGTLGWFTRVDTMRRGDILLPRLHRVTNIVGILVIPGLALPAFVWLRRRRGAILPTLALLASGAALAICNSRSAFAVLALSGPAFIVIVWLTMRQRSHVYSASAALVVLAIGFSSVHAVDLGRRPRHLARYGFEGGTREWLTAISEDRAEALRIDDEEAEFRSVVNRKQEMVCALPRSVKEFLIGRGMGAMMSFRGVDNAGNPAISRWSRVHNAYVYALYSAGFPAAALFLCLMVGAVLSALRVALRGSREIRPGAVCAFLVLATLSLAMNATGMIFHYGAVWVSTALAIGVSWTAVTETSVNGPSAKKVGATA